MKTLADFLEDLRDYLISKRLKVVPPNTIVYGVRLDYKYNLSDYSFISSLGNSITTFEVSQNVWELRRLKKDGTPYKNRILTYNYLVATSEQELKVMIKEISLLFYNIHILTSNSAMQYHKDRLEHYEKLM